MAWGTSNRRSQLPANWGQLRLLVFQRDNWTCVDCGHRDITGATLECDHTGDRNDHRLTVLITRCGRYSPNNCHGRKSSAEGHAARPQARRPKARHPGLTGS